MLRYEYKVVPAPAKGEKSKAVKTPEGRFALSVEGVLNEMGVLGWEYLRAELLPSEERSGLTGTVTNWRNVLVFRREIAEDLGPPRAQFAAVTGAHGAGPKTAKPLGPALSVPEPRETAQDGDEAEMPEDGKPGDEGIDDEIASPGTDAEPDPQTR